MPEQLGWLDTNLFVHALFPHDPHQARCRAIVRALEEGRAEGWLDPLVVHELSYVLSRLGQRFPTRTAIEEYLRGILLIDAIHADDKGGAPRSGGAMGDGQNRIRRCLARGAGATAEPPGLFRQPG